MVSTGPASDKIHIPAPRLIRSLDDFAAVEFYNDMTLVDVPVEALDALPLKNDRREDDPRLKQIIRAIRDEGYNSASPIKVRIGRRGNWVVVDGGHRLTAARKVAKEFWCNLFGRKVRTQSFLVYRTPLSNTLPPDAPGADDEDHADARHPIPTVTPAGVSST